MSKYPQLQDAAWLRRRYVEERASINEIAVEVGCTGMTVHRALVQHTIPRRRPGEHRPKAPQLADPDWLREQYGKAGRSVGSIAAELGVTDSGVRAALVRHDIPRRTPKESRKRRGTEYRERVDWKDVERRYAAGEGFGPIGETFGVTGHFIRKVLIERGVTVRTKAEQNRLEMSRTARRERMQAAARERCRPTGVRGMKKAIAEGTSCSFCGVDGHLHHHHLNAVRSDDRPENLVPLCADCHRKVEWFIGHATKGLREAYSTKE